MDHDLDRIRDIRNQLLDLHKLLVDVERQVHERAHGRTSPAEFLRFLLEDDQHAWLRPLTALIVRADEWLDDDERSPEVAAAWVDELVRMLQPSPALHDFHTRYAALLQENPEVVLAHRGLMQAVRRSTGSQA